jgi:cytidylate kinase
VAGMSGVRAIRGAITVEENDKKSILDGTVELLNEIARVNGITEEDIISIIFTVTDDLNTAFPAEAARNIGWVNTPLMCAREINVPGSLQKCVRVLMHVNSAKEKNEIKHVYLKGARVLRKDIVSKNEKDDCSVFSIAIDGPAGSGKSTISKILAKKLGLIYLDTGAMYRTVALKAIREGIDTMNRDAVANMVRDINMEVVFQNGEQRMYLDGEDVTPYIRSMEVTKGSSDVAVVPEVRLKLVEKQREIAKRHGVVMDGRDIGTYVLPDAKFKFFLTATPEERARRRYLELLGKGNNNVTIEEILVDINYRDKNDSSRKFAPLAKADDAIEIDTTFLSIYEVANKILGFVEGA